MTATANDAYTSSLLDYVAENADPLWADLADDAIRKLAGYGCRFTAADVTRLAGQPDHPNRLGAVMHRAAKAGLIRVVDYAKSERRERHSGLVRVWQGAVA